VDPAADDARRLVLEAARRAAAYVADDRQRGVFPSDASLAGLAGFGNELPPGPTPPDEVLAQLDGLGSPATVDTTHGRYFGFVVGGTDPAAAAATTLAAAWDQNVGTPVMSPVGTHLDALAARWVCALLGLAPEATATFCAGATVANLTCVLAARDTLLRRAGWDTRRQGLGQAPPLRVVTSAEVHVSALKALHMAGIGTDAITFVPTDESGRVRAEHFPAVDALTIVVLQAGNVNTGHSDPFRELIPRARAAGAWVHVDGAFGLWAAASARRRHLVEGVELADSWATDAHKWLNAPYDSGIAICAREEDLRRSFAADAAYLLGEAGRVLMHLGVQMSQRARGIETWAIIASRGRSGIADLVDDACDRAQEFAALLSVQGAEVLAPVVLNQALVHFDDDATTDAVIAAVQRDGTCWAGGTTWQGRRAMRLSVSDVATTPEDIAVSARAILRCWNIHRHDRRK
jgi:glutamate/tyrosine decarboxylase-like PLP-dependent enzyme